MRSTVYYLHEGSGFEATGWGDYADDVAVVDGVGLITRKVFTPAQHLPGSLAGLAARLERLETAELARAASWRYATAIDTLDFDLLGDGVHRGRRAHDAKAAPARAATRSSTTTARRWRTRWAASTSWPTRPSPGWRRVGALMESYFIYTFAGTDTSILGWGNYVDRVRVVDGVGLHRREAHLHRRPRRHPRRLGRARSPRDRHSRASGSLVTGAAQGMGRAIAVECARAGAEAVTVVDLKVEDAEETAALVARRRRRARS